MKPKRLAFLGAIAVAVALAAAGSALAAGPTPQFDSVHAYGVGVSPHDVAIGDLDLDGTNDLVVVNAGSDTVSVLLLDPDGSVRLHVDYPAGDSPRSVAIGDLDGDPFPELAVANYGFPASGSVTVLDTAGGGLFTSAVDYPFPRLSSSEGIHPLSIAIGDLDADGASDIAVASDFQTVAILYQRGMAFNDGLTVLEGLFNPSSVAIGDVNGDGVDDLAATLSGAGTVAVWHGGTGGLTKTEYATGSNPSSVAIGDVSGDGRADLVVANRFPHNVSVLLADPAGGFQPKFDLPAGGSPWSVAIGDLNADGFPEIVTANASNPGGGVSVLPGTGGGAFQAAIDVPIGGTHYSLAIGDVNGDFVPDVATTEVIGGVVEVLHNTTVNTQAGSNVRVVPPDPRTGGTPVTITFANVVAGGTTTMVSSPTGPPPPPGFLVQGSYYELATTAQFDFAEICFAYSGPPTPSIVHWVAGIPVIEPITRDTGTEICAVVTSFSPFALVVPAVGDDTTAPVVSCGSADGVWHAGDVSIDCTAQDDGSGLADPADAAFSLSTSVPAGTEDGDVSTGYRVVCDVAGNCATAGPIAGNKIDRKAPTLSLPADMTVNATSPAGATVSFSPSALDGADPDPAVSCTPSSGSVFALGTTTVECSATDHVGNESAGSFAVTVLEAATPTCDGKVATIVGTPGPTEIRGTSGNDVIVDLDGDNIVRGRGGSDTVCTGDGNDQVHLGAGADTVIDTGGTNTIEGGAGGDVITTGTGADTVNAGLGADAITDAGGDNTLEGGAGADAITTGAGDDTINAGAGADTINAGEGDNTVNGQAGDDTITTGDANDTIDGGLGFDRCTPGGGFNAVSRCEA